MRKPLEPSEAGRSGTVMVTGLRLRASNRAMSYGSAAGGPRFEEAARCLSIIWSELVVSALCGASLVVWIGRDLAARGRERRTGGQNGPYLKLRSSSARAI